MDCFGDLIVSLMVVVLCAVGLRGASGLPRCFCLLGGLRGQLDFNSLL